LGIALSKLLELILQGAPMRRVERGCRALRDIGDLAAPQRHESERAHRLFADLALPDPERLGQRYPHEISGGQLQRAIAAMPAAPRPQASQAPAAAPSPKPANNNLMVSEDQVGWTNQETTSGLDNSKTEIAILPAATAKLSRFATSGSAQHAALIIRCREGKTDLYVAYSDIVDGMEHSISVQYRIGGAPVKTERWGISQDFQSYGTWQTAATVPFIKSLQNADEFYVRGDAGPMGTSEASFKLAGIDGAIAPVRAACHW